MIATRTLRFVTLIYAGGLAVFLAAIGTSVAHAGALSAEQCKSLVAERDGMVARGVRQMMEAGPKSGVTSPQQLVDVRRLFEMEGQLRFRCPFEDVLASLKEDGPEDGDGAEDDAAAPATPAVKAKSGGVQPKSIVKPRAGGVESKSEKQAPAATDIQREAATEVEPKTKGATKSRAKPEPKVDDAYRPPSGADVNGTSLNKQSVKPLQ